MQRLAATTSRIDKEQIVMDAFMNQCHEFFVGAKLALDPLVSFGVAKVAEILEDDGDPGDLTFSEFLELANRLRTRALSGNGARDAIRDAAARCHAPTWNLFYRRVLLKDLKVGVETKTINKVLKKLAAYPEAREHIIPVFACQLAEDGEDPKHKKKVKGRRLIDAKLDGVRTLAVLDKDTDSVKLFSRNGLQFGNFPELHEALHKLLPKLPGAFVLDGEMVSPQGFQHLMKMVQRKEYHADMASIRYAVFDILPLGDFKMGECRKTQAERHALLEALHEAGLWSETAGKVYVIPQIEIDFDTDEGQAAFAEFSRRTLADGYEGIMIKDPEAPYLGKRSVAWLKSKPVIDVSLEVVGFQPGDPDSKYRHTLGALMCRGIDNGMPIATNVSGMSDELRDEIWRNQTHYLGMIAEVRADKLTLEESAQIYSLRFPRLKGFRGRTPGEKL